MWFLIPTVVGILDKVVDSDRLATLIQSKVQLIGREKLAVIKRLSWLSITRMEKLVVRTAMVGIHSHQKGD